MAEDDTTEGKMMIVAQITSAYVSNNNVRPGDLAGLISDIYSAFVSLDNLPSYAPATPTPAVSVKRSVTPDHLICLEDGKTFKSLKRHLATAHGLTPAEYREKWQLPASYPMVAPNYSEARSAVAKSVGLGGRRTAKRKRSQSTTAK